MWARFFLLFFGKIPVLGTHFVEYLRQFKKKLDQVKIVIRISLDLQKFFDTVAHQILLKRLDCMGNRRTPNNLIKSYLERKESTKIANEIS